MRHKTQVDSGRRHRAHCSCGWYAVTTVSRGHAERMAQQHIASSDEPQPTLPYYKVCATCNREIEGTRTVNRNGQVVHGRGCPPK